VVRQTRREFLAVMSRVDRGFVTLDGIVITVGYSAPAR
jgi:hypothetical protein